MLYLLDANILITAKNLYYEFGRVDQYWEWLSFQAEHQGNRFWKSENQKGEHKKNFLALSLRS